ncbi:MAG: NAD(P)H-binding protein [Candidatus Sumerlaeota bacterium]|nr:NAD(P)H-binding protein [Candidatus Sumerlaeota bacterium]
MTEKSTEVKRRVLVTGAAGFVGRSQTQILTQRGHSVVAMVHSAPMAVAPGVSVVKGDVRDKASLERALDGCDSVIHLAAAKNDEKFSREVNAGGTANLIAAAQARGVRRCIYISTQADPRGLYGATKYEGERLVRDSALDWTVLKPNLIYGNDQNGAFMKVARGVKGLPFFPVMGPARGKFWPIHVEDNCLATVICLENNATIRKTYILAGPDGVTLPELAAMIARQLGTRACMIHLPLWFSLLAARACCALRPNRPPLSVSNVLGCNQENVDHDIAAMINELGVTPRTLEVGLRDVFNENCLMKNEK